MDKLIANASVGLAKAGMNRRGFLGRLARATGGAAVLTGLAAVGVSASSHCSGPYFCETGSYYETGFCGDYGCGNDKGRYHVRTGVHCLSGGACHNEVTLVGCISCF